MTSPPLESTHGRMMSGVACHHRPRTAHKVGRHRAWHDIIALGQHTLSDYVAHGMTSPPLDGTHGRKMSGVACHHRPWVAHTIKLRRVWHDITALGLQSRSNNIGHGIKSPPLDSMHGRTTSGVALHHRPRTAHTFDNIWRGIPSPPLGCTHGQTTLRVA